MKEVVQEGLVARLGGDEYAVLLPRVVSKQIARQTARHVIENLKQPIQLDGESVTVGASIGIAYGPENGDTTSRLLHAADLAMYSAKQRRLEFSELCESPFADQYGRIVDAHATSVALHETAMHLPTPVGTMRAYDIERVAISVHLRSGMARTEMLRSSASAPRHLKPYEPRSTP